MAKLRQSPRMPVDIEVFWQRGTQHFIRNVIGERQTKHGIEPMSMIDEDENLIAWREELPPVEIRDRFIGLETISQALEVMQDYYRERQEAQRDAEAERLAREEAEREEWRAQERERIRAEMSAEQPPPATSAAPKRGRGKPAAAGAPA